MAFRLPPLSALRVFEAAARHNSFQKAATELNLTASAVSHAIQTLENWLGVALFHRSTRAVRLSEIGESYYKDCAELLKRAHQFWDFVKRDVEPIILPPAPPPISDWKEYNMTGNDRWRRFAEQWRQTRGAASSCEEASKILKSMVPADAKKCFGDGVVITRDRAGRQFLRADIPDQVDFA